MIARIALITGLLVGVKSLVTSTVKEKFTARLNTSKFKVNFTPVAILVNSGLEVENHSNAELTVNEIRATFAIIANGERTVIANSLPSSKVFKIKPLSVSNLDLPTIRIGNFSVLGNLLKIKNVLLNPEDKFELVINAKINGFPFTETIRK